MTLLEPFSWKKSFLRICAHTLLVVFIANTGFSFRIQAAEPVRETKFLKQKTQELLDICKAQLVGEKVSAQAGAPITQGPDAQMKEWIHQAFKLSTIVQYGPMDAMVIKSFRSSIEKNAFRICQIEGYCSKEDVFKSVVQSIDAFFKRFDQTKVKIRVVRGYVIIATAILFSAYFTSFIKENMPANISWLSELIPILTTIGAMKFGAPLWDNLNSFSTSTAFKLKTGKSLFEEELPETNKLDQLYDAVQAEFSPNQQAARSYLVVALSNIRASFKEFTDLSASGERESALRRLAEAIILLRKYYPLLLDDRLDVYNDVLRAADMLFVQAIPDVDERIKIYEELMSLIEKNDPDIEADKLRKHYSDVLKDWFQLSQDYDWII